MSAKILREAANLMRERAEAVLQVDRDYPEDTGGPAAFYSPAFIEDAFRKHAPVDPPYSDGCVLAWEASGEHLASWPPRVAVAVADWLDEIAVSWNLHAGMRSQKRALAVAHSYLDGSS